MRKPFVGSIILHVLFFSALLWASIEKANEKPPLPEVTKVKLIRPKAPQVPVQKIEAKEIKAPETAPPLEQPKKDKKKTEPKKEALTEKKPRSTEKAPKELKGEAGTLKVQQSGFEYDFYLALVQSKIERNFRPPPGVRGNLMATVGFVILADGSISTITLVTASGNLLIDQAAERAVRSAGKLPPLPAQYEEGQLGINFEFVVNPNTGS
jgi:colicin import membrane protein